MLRYWFGDLEVLAVHEHAGEGSGGEPSRLTGHQLALSIPDPPAQAHPAVQPGSSRPRLAALLVVLGILLGAQQLTRATDLAGQALGDATRTARDVGWLLLLLVAAGLVLGLGLSSRRGRAAARWLQARLTTRPVRWAAAAVGVLLVLVLVGLPPRFTVYRSFDKAADELKAQNDVRTTLLQALAGGVLLLGAYFTWRQLRVTLEGQLTDRYTKAVDQLGSDHLDVRVGGIYALERIARDSPYDRATIEEVLTAYVRDHAPWPPPPAPPPPSLQAIAQRLVTVVQRQRSARQRRTAKTPAGHAQQGQPGTNGAEPQGPPADVQAAMTVLGRREHPPGGRRPLDLTRVDLRRVQLEGANLRDADLDGANLQGAELPRANLHSAHLDGANLQDADLDGANLRVLRPHGRRPHLIIPTRRAGAAPRHGLPAMELPHHPRGRPSGRSGSHCG